MAAWWRVVEWLDGYTQTDLQAPRRQRCRLRRALQRKYDYVASRIYRIDGAFSVLFTMPYYVSTGEKYFHKSEGGIGLKSIRRAPFFDLRFWLEGSHNGLRTSPPTPRRVLRGRTRRIRRASGQLSAAAVTRCVFVWGRLRGRSLRLRHRAQTETNARLIAAAHATFRGFARGSEGLSMFDRDRHPSMARVLNDARTAIAAATGRGDGDASTHGPLLRGA